MPGLVVGLTGGIASGKTLVATQFESLGVPVLDADQVARDVVTPGAPALMEIAQHFGNDFITAEGTLDRRRMREHVFGNDTARRRLEDILHPRIAQAMTQWRDAQTTPYCILSVAILLESRMAALVNRVLVVDVAESVQLARLTRRDGISTDLASRMLEAQMRREARLQRADDVIRNEGDPDACLQQVTQLHQRYLQMTRPSN